MEIFLFHELLVIYAPTKNRTATGVATRGPGTNAPGPWENAKAFTKTLPPLGRNAERSGEFADRLIIGSTYTQRKTAHGAPYAVPTK